MNKNNTVILVGLLFLTGCLAPIPDLGINNGNLMPCPKTPNCVNSQAADESHYIQPILIKGTQQEAFGLLLRILESEKRTEILIVEKNYIRVEFTSALFRFIDDVEFFFPEKQTEGTLIHVRSASRVGYSDFGTNRKRIEQIRNKFKESLN